MSLVPDDSFSPGLSSFLDSGWEDYHLSYYTRAFCYLQKNTILSDIPRLIKSQIVCGILPLVKQGHN